MFQIIEKKNRRENGGVAIFIAVIAVASLMLIATAISNLSYKEQIISQSGRDSKVAFFAADSGMECALFHDLKGGVNGLFTFATPSQAQSGTLYCNGVEVSRETDLVGGSMVTKFYFNVPSGSGDETPTCSVVTVTKTLSGSDIETVIESSGYNNTCSGSIANPDIGDVNDTRNLERALRVEY
jgi:hypothetical protein